MGPAEDTVVDGACLGRYLIEERIGSGGMRSVFKARHRDLDKAVAIEVLRRDLAEKDALRARFLQKARTIARLGHPHIIDVTDVGPDEDCPYIVMKLLEGESLAKRLDRCKPLDVPTAIGRLLRVVARVMDAHDRGMIHRDIEHENVILMSYGGRIHPKVLDFGIAKCLAHPMAQELTESGIVFGTAHYMSPEQARGAKHVDARTDQSSLAVVLYPCITGELPYPGQSFLQVVNRITTGQYSRPPGHRPGDPERARGRALEDGSSVEVGLGPGSLTVGGRF